MLDLNGTVLAASDGAPTAWIGSRLETCEDAPLELRRAAVEALHDVRQPGRMVPATTLPLLSGGQTVHLMTIEALPLRRTRADLRALLSTTLQVLRQQAEAIDVTLRIAVDDGVPDRLACDPEKIAWAVATLVGNALRYVRSGSRRMPGGSIAVHAAYDPAAAEATIAVQDDGPGIPAAKLPSLFDRSRDQAHAVGLSLAMVHDVIVAHGGRVDVESSTDPFGHGTTIRMTFPSAPPPPSPSRPDLS